MFWKEIILGLTCSWKLRCHTSVTPLTTSENQVGLEGGGVEIAGKGLSKQFVLKRAQQIGSLV